MAALLPTDMRSFILVGSNLTEPRDFRPLDVVEPEDIQFACFFYDDDDRAVLLSRLREIANLPPVAAPGEDIERQMEDCRLKGDAAGLFSATVRWWTGVKRLGYHAYKLRVGVDRYRCSAVIAFRERSPEELKAAITPAVEELEEAKERVAGFFQYPFD